MKFIASKYVVLMNYKLNYFNANHNIGHGIKKIVVLCGLVKKYSAHTIKKMKENISKFAPPVVMILMGLGLAIVGFMTMQNGLFISASVAVAFGGIITLLNATGIITNKASLGVAGLLALVSAYFAYANFTSIDGPIQFNKEKKVRYAHVIQNLKDLREIELAFKKEHKKFCPNMDTLIQFALYDSVYTVKMFGDVPDSLTESQALEQGIIKRDTSLIAAKDFAFSPEYLKTRAKNMPLDIENLRFIPFTENAVFDIDAGEITRSSGAKVQVFQITDAQPFDKYDVMKVGSMTDPSTAGNWKEEK
jgi:hypothetical protein